MYGHMGKVLIADLGNLTYEIQDLNPEWAKDFISGPSLGARYLYDLMPAHTPATSNPRITPYPTHDNHSLFTTPRLHHRQFVITVPQQASSPSP